MFRQSVALAIGLFLLSSGGVLADPLTEGFVNPPGDARPLVRWWWFGPKVEPAEIDREIAAMKAGGFGGFELQTVYPLSVEGNVPYLSASYLAAVRRAGETAAKAGLRMDVTLGSGWPFGGPHIPPALASTQIRLRKQDLPAGAQTVALPPLKTAERIVAVFVGANAASARLVAATGNAVTVSPSHRDRTVFIVVQCPTGQHVKRAAVGAEGYVLDHLNADAVRRHLETVGAPLLAALQDHPPYAVFSDSLEAFGADWTDDLLAEFSRRRGYDLAPHLLALFVDGPESAALRRDWGLTLSELTDERYLRIVDAWAAQRGTRFRSQNYGTPPVTLSSNRLVALAEGEGLPWRTFTTSRWASSANHLYDQTVTSAESWTWLHYLPFQATPLDIKASADQLMLEGVNQFVGHGWPYSPPSAGEPGQTFYAAAALNDHNPWWGVMPDLNRYLQRMSFLLRQGTPVADVAIYLPTDDAFARIRADIAPGEFLDAQNGAASVSDAMPSFVTEALTTQILDAGYAFDYIDDQAVLTRGLSYKVLILPRVTRIAPEVYAKIAAFAKSGGIVLAVDHAPDTAPGWRDAAAETAAVHAIRQTLFAAANAPGRVLAETELGAALRARLTADMAGASSSVGFVHRRLADGDLYFVANTSNRPVRAALRFRTTAMPAQWWDARLGVRHRWAGEPVTLAPYESRVFVFGPSAAGPATDDNPYTANLRVLSSGWSLAFGSEPSKALPAFVSWSAIPGRRHYSGVAVYSRVLTLSAADIAAGLTTLDFGAGAALLPSVTPGRAEMSALLAAPVREAAEVFVNGRRVGSVWVPPFTVSLARAVHPGKNRLEIRVANTAINALSGRPPANVAALTAKYGERFRASDPALAQPQPSGLLQAPVLTTP